MNDNHFTTIFVLKKTLKIIVRKPHYLIGLFLINSILLFFVYFLISERAFQLPSDTPLNLAYLLKLINQKIFYIYALSLPISIVVNTYLSLLIKDTLLDNEYTLHNQIKNTMKNIKYYFIGSLTLLISYLGFILLLSLVIFLPFFKSFLFLFCIAFFLFFIAYFRFVPYTAILTESHSDLFKKTFQYLTGHLSVSIALLFLFGILTSIFGSLQGQSMTEFLTDTSHFFKMFSLFILYECITFLSNITDIVFVTLLYQNKKNLT